MNTQVRVEALDRRENLLQESPKSFVVGTYGDFESLPLSYHRVFEEHSASSFCHSLPWYQNFSQYALDPGDQVRIYAVESAGLPGTPLAILPVRYVSGVAKRGRAKSLSSLTNYYTMLYAPLVSPEVSLPEVLGELARFVFAESPRWDMVNLSCLDRDSPVFSELARSFRRAGMIVQTYFCFGNWYLPVEGRTYQQYFESLRSSVRNIAKSKNRKVERSGRARVEVVTGMNGLDAAISAYEQVYAASWKKSEPYPLFVPGLIQLCAREGWLRLGVAYVDGQPAAAQLWIVSHGVASIYKVAYDQRFADLSIGSYLTTRLLEHVIDVDRVREVDYLSGDDRYKSDWMSHRRERWGILALNPRTVRGALGIIRHIGGRSLKRAALRVWRRLAATREKPGAIS